MITAYSTEVAQVYIIHVHISHFQVLRSLLGIFLCLTKQVGVKHGGEQAEHHRQLPGGEETSVFVFALRRRPYVLGSAGFNSVFGDHLADEELLHELLGVEAVADVVELLCGVLAGVIEQHLVSTGVIVQELGDVVHSVVNDEHRIQPGVVGGDIAAFKLFERHVGASELRTRRATAEWLHSTPASLLAPRHRRRPVAATRALLSYYYYPNSRAASA